MLIDYLIDKKGVIGLILLNISILLLILFLNNVDMYIGLYAGLISITVSFIIGFFDLKKYIAKSIALDEVKENIDVNIEGINTEISILEDRYVKVINELYDENINLKTGHDKKSKEMIDYYTLWVHQVKTPISAMNLILQHDDFNKKELSSELFKVEEYVSMVLGYLRLSQEQSDLVIAEHKLDNILKNSIKKYSRLFIRKGLMLKYTPSDLNIITDEKWFEFAIEQILSNCIKYTKEGSISIYTSSNKLYIKDTGVGIAPEDLPRIFDKGFTGYNGRANKKSTGLGLYLTRSAFDKLSYKLDVESEVGSGTTIIIDLSMQKISEY